jgi:hypothetical protein
MQWKLLSVAIGTVAIAALWADRSDVKNYPYIPCDHPAIDYPALATENEVAKLQTQLEHGEAKLSFDAKWGYLPSLLKHFGINTDSQMLVF